MTNRAHTTKLRLYPDPRVLAGEEGIYQDLDIPAPGSPKLPYVLVNMVASVDGRSSVGGKASGIGSPDDRGAMRALRSHVDAVMVGAGTLRAEKLNLGLDDPGARQPLAVVVGGAGDLPIAERLVDGRQGVVLVLPEDDPRGAQEAGQGLLHVLKVPRRAPSPNRGRVDLTWLLGALRGEHDVDSLLVEGGPALNRALVDEGLADEIFLTISSKLLPGPESAILSGGPERAPIGLVLVSVHSSDDELFLRYRIKKPT